MKERIRQLMETQHMNQLSFATYIGISTASLNSILQGKTRPTLKTVEAICGKMPEVNLSWLLNGTGEMFVGGVPEHSNDSVQTRDLFHQSDMQDAHVAGFDFEQEHSEGSRLKDNFEEVPNVRHRENRNLGGDGGKNYGGVKKVDIKPRRITEIRVFFDDQTWESFVPKK